MSNSNSSTDSPKKPDVKDYNDFYDLLGVRKGTDEKEIEKRARKLLGEFHPDVNDHPKADDVYKEVNRAQDVLTDTEQRRIYDQIGHNEYVKRRESDGAVSMQETVTDDDNFTAVQPDVGKEEVVSTDPSDTTSDHGSTNRNQRNTWAGSQKVEEGYKSITNLDMGLSPSAVVKKLYRELWLSRAVICFVFIVGIIYFGRSNPTVVTAIWGGVGGPTSYGIYTTAILLAVMVVSLITFVSGAITFKVLRSTAEKISMEDDSGDSQKNASESTNTEDSWDVHSRYDSSGNSGREDRERETTALTRGSRMLFVGLVMAGFGSVVSGIHVWDYLKLLLSGGGIETALWWDIGSEGTREVVVLLNIGYAFAMFLLSVVGALLVSHGLSREIWYKKYFTEENPFPFIWDTIIAACLAVVGTSLFYRGRAVEGASINWLPEQATDFLAATNGVTTTSLLMVGLLSLLSSVLILKIRESIA